MTYESNEIVINKGLTVQVQYSADMLASKQASSIYLVFTALHNVSVRNWARLPKAKK